jgi:hypothetical protein
LLKLLSISILSWAVQPRRDFALEQLFKKFSVEKLPTVSFYLHLED